jgi:hypothetical protein
LPKGLKMSTIAFTEARFFNPLETRYAVERRFSEHLEKLRRTRKSASGAGAAQLSDEAGFQLPDLLSDHDDGRIQRRAHRLMERREAATGLSHLKKEDRARLEILRDGVRLIAIASEHRADELAAQLHAEMPWMAAVNEVVWHAMRRSVREGWPGFRAPPLLLDGPPGIGKSHWARRLGELLSVPTTVIEATGENASFSIVGSQRGWSGAYPGRALETVLQTQVGNPVIVVDEIEKAGLVVSSKGQAFGLAEGLLPLLEPMTARRWSCPYFQVKFDMSWMSWILTSNNFRQLPMPLLNRCPPTRLQEPTATDLDRFVRRQGTRDALSDASIEAIVSALAHAVRHGQRPTLRAAVRLLRYARDLESRPMLH